MKACNPLRTKPKSELLLNNDRHKRRRSRADGMRQMRLVTRRGGRLCAASGMESDGTKRNESVQKLKRGKEARVKQEGSARNVAVDVVVVGLVGFGPTKLGTQHAQRCLQATLHLSISEARPSC